jgi:hypothetical protein
VIIDLLKKECRYFIKVQKPIQKKSGLAFGVSEERFE